MCDGNHETLNLFFFLSRDLEYLTCLIKSSVFCENVSVLFKIVYLLNIAIGDLNQSP